MNQKGAERRIFPRKLLQTKVIFEDEFGEGLIWMQAEDISLGGFFISADIPIKVGSYVFVSFYLPGDRVKIRTTGQVVRVSEGKKGMGVRFIGLSPEAIDAIREYTS